MNNNTKKSWAKEEDIACCKACIDNYVIKDSGIKREEFISDVSSMPEFSERDKSSIRMRIQNVKALLEEMDVKNSLPIRPLVNSAKQTREVLTKLLQDNGIIKA